MKKEDKKVISITEALKIKGRDINQGTKLSDLLNMPVVVEKIETMPSRLRPNETVMRIHGRYHGTDDHFTVVTASKVIMDKLLTVRDLLPVSGKFVKPRGKRYYDFV